MSDAARVRAPANTWTCTIVIVVISWHAVVVRNCDFLLQLCHVVIIWPFHSDFV